MRTVVTHVHLFKNAGTSIEQALERRLGPKWAGYDGGATSSLLNVHELAAYLDERPELEAVSSHRIRPPLRGVLGFNFLPLVFLRHPIDRIRSAYDFERQQGAETPSSIAARSRDLSSWIAFHRERRSSQVADFQTLALTSIRDGDGRPAAAGLAEHRSSAQEFLASLPAFGLVEHFDESCLWINEWLKLSKPEIQLEPQHANSTSERALNVASRLDQMRNTLGPATYEQLLEENTQDIALWEWATARALGGFGDVFQARP